MKAFILAYLIVILNQIKQVQLQSTCSMGCTSCNYDDSKQLFICSQCDEGYFLDQIQNICIYQQCDQNLYLQQRLDTSQNKCVTICDDYYQVNSKSNTCNQLDQCPHNFITNTVFSSNSLLNNIISYNDEAYLMRYEGFLNYVKKDTGQILLRFNITSEIAGVFFVNGQLVSILLDQSINLWKIETNEHTLVDKIQQGNFTTLSQINYLQDQSYCVTSFESQKKLVYFNIIRITQQTDANQNQPQFFQISSNNQKVYFFSKYIITQIDTAISLCSIEKLQGQSSFSLNQITPNNICSVPTLLVIQDFIYSTLNNKYIFTYQNYQGLFLIDGKGQVCQEITVNSSIRQILLYHRQNKSDLILIQLDTQILIRKLDDLLNDMKVISVSQNSSILDVLISQISTQIQFFILTNQKQIINVLSTNQDDSTTFNQLQQLQVAIDSPLQLIAPFNSNNQLDSFFITGFDFQQIVINNQSIDTKYIIQSFRQIYQANKDKTNKLFYDDAQSLIYQCSQDGMFTIWNLVTIFRAEYYKEFIFSGDICRDFVLLKGKIVAIALNKQIVIFDVTNPSSKKYLTQANQQAITSFSLFTNQKYILAYFDSCIQLIDENQNVLINQCFVDHFLYVMISPDDYIYAYGSTFIRTYSIDLPNTTLIEQSSGISNAKSILNYFIDESIQNKRYFMYYDQNTLQLIILDETFTLLVQAQISNVQQLVDIKPFIDLNNKLRFFLIHQTTLTSVTSKYLVSTIMPGESSINTFYNVFQSPGIIEIFNYFNNAGELIFKVATSSSLSYTCLVFFVKFNSNQNIGLVEQYSFNRDDSITYSAQNKKFKFVSTGNGSGLLGISPSNPNYSKKIYENGQADTSEIQQIFQSYQLNRIFVIKKVIIEIDQILSSQIGEITFDDSGMSSSEYVQGFQVYNHLRIIACYKSYQFLIKSFHTDLPVVYKLKNFGVINNYYLSEATKSIFIYGTKLSKFDLTLNSEVVILSQLSQGKTISQCIFPSNLIICKYGDFSLIFINLSDYSILKQFDVSGIEKGFSLSFDPQTSLLFLYKQSIQYYNFGGIYLNTLQQPTQEIIEFNLYGSKIVVFTRGNGYIYDRSNQNYLTSFLSSFAGNIKKSLYLEQYNHVLYISDETRVGQIFTFNLDMLVELNPIKFAYNPLIQIVDMQYEDETKMLYFVDYKGNVEVQIYLQTNDNILPIDDFSNDPPKGFSMDLITNSLIVYNGKFVIQLNYQLLTRGISRYTDPLKTQAIIKTDPSNNNSKYIILDSLNIIYEYNNYSLSYSSFFQDRIIGIKQNSDQSVIVIYFQTYFLIYLNKSYDFKYQSNNYSFKVDGYRIYRFISDQIFQTHDFQLIHYDFVGNTPFKILNIPKTLTIKCYLATADLILLGLSSGSIIGYNISQKNEFTIQLQSTSGLTNILQTVGQYWFTQRDGTLSVFSSTNLNASSLPSLRKNLVTITNNQSTIDDTPIDINNFAIDESQNRYFVQFSKQKKLSVIDINKHTIQKLLSFPTDEISRIKFTPSLVVLYSIAQLNIHKRDDLQYQYQIRCNNRRDEISDLLVINDQIFIVTFIRRLDIYYAPSNSQTVTLVNSLTTNFSIIIQALYDPLTTLLKLVGYSTTNLFEKKYWFKNYSNNSLACSSVIDGQTSVDFLRKLSIVNSVSISRQRLFYLSLFDMEPINGINQSTTSMILKPQNSQLQDFNVNLKTLLMVKNNAYLKDFSFYFQEKGVYNFNVLSKQIFIQDVKINSQNILGIQLKFQSKTLVVINNLKLNSIIDNKALRTLSQKDVNNNANKEAQGKQNYRILVDQSDLSFLYFQDCDTVMIYNLQLLSMDIRVIKNFIYISNVKKVIIKNLEVYQSYFNILFLLDQIENLIIENVIFKNNSALSLSYTSPKQLIVIQGSLQTTIKNVVAEKCNDYQILYITNQYQNNNEVINFKNDVVLIDTVESQYNKISNIDYNQDFNQIYIQSTQLQLNNIHFNNNDMNILIQNSKNIQLMNSDYNNNTNLLGGALQFKSIEGIISIVKTIFQSNVARASGGAIYAENIHQIDIDDQSNISQNSALIGGGIRIIGDDPIFNISPDSINNNIAEIFGNNIGTIPIDILIYSNSELKNNYSFTKYINNPQYYGRLYIMNYQSGSSSQLSIAYIDRENTRVSFSPEKIKNSGYPNVIIKEITQWYIQIESLNVADIQITGEQQVSYNQFDVDQKAFIFNEMYINSDPNTKQTLSLKFQVSSLLKRREVQVDISLRPCITGEIYKYFSQTIDICFVCKEGYYSIQIPKKGSEIECKKCPNEAQICEKDNIILKEGYWREGKTDSIFQCNPLKNSCNENDKFNQKGCVKGYVGPLCDQCDLSGKLWGNRFSKNGIKQECVQCSTSNIQFIVVFSSGLGLLIYMLIQIQSFVKNFSLYQTCNYLRLANLLPISASQMNNQNSFYIKCLMNYIQLQSILVDFQIQYIPQSVLILPNFFGQPSSQIIVNLMCILSPEIINKYGVGKSQIVILTIIPLIYFSIILLVFFIAERINCQFKVKSTFKYTALNFLFIFFQSDSINSLTRFLTCKEIGTKSYITDDLLYECSDPEYVRFQNYFAIPLLIFWILIPAIVYYLIHRRNKILNYCSSIFIYGYYYIEYHPSKYYWEFIRIYFKVTIVIFYTLYKKNEMLAHMLIIFLIAIYTSFLQKKKPFVNPNMMKFEELSYYTLISIILLKNLIDIYSNSVFEFLYMVLHISFILYIIGFIIYSKLLVRNTVFRQAFIYLMQKIFRRYSFFKLNRSFSTEFKTFLRWKKISYNIKVLTNQKAIDRISKIKPEELEISTSQQGYDKQKELIDKISTSFIKNSQNPILSIINQRTRQTSLLFSPKTPTRLSFYQATAKQKPLTERIPDNQSISQNKQVKFATEDNLEQEDMFADFDLNNQEFMQYKYSNSNVQQMEFRTMAQLSNVMSSRQNGGQLSPLIINDICLSPTSQNQDNAKILDHQ